MTKSAEVRQGPQPINAGILAVIDDSPEAMGVLEAAVDLARRQRVGVRAIFVEELDLVRSAGFSFASEIGALSGSIRPRPHEHLSGELRRRARRVGLVLERMAAASGITHELIVRRGRVVSETLILASPDDLLIVGRVGWSRRLGRSFGSVPLALAHKASGAVLIWSSGSVATGGHVALLAEDDATLDDVVKWARARALARHVGLTALLLPQPNASQRSELEGHIAAGLEGSGVPFEIRELSAANVASLLHALGQSGAVELVLSRRGRLLSDSTGARLLERIQLPVCVVP